MPQTGMSNPGRARALIESNAREAADLVGELTLLLDRAGNGDPSIAAARMLARRIADRLGQVMTLERWAQGSVVRADTWSPIDVVEELEHEAVALVGARIDVQVVVPQLVPQCWYFDRELVTMTLGNALHSALRHATAELTLELLLHDGYLGFRVQDDAGAYPGELIDDALPSFELGDMNCNALGIHFARQVAHAHVNGARRGRLDLANQSTAGTSFTLWLP